LLAVDSTDANNNCHAKRLYVEYATQGEVNSQRRSESIAHTLGEISFTSKGGCHTEILCVMPEEEPIERAREDEREGLSPSTQAGEFVREEMEHIREDEHGARSPQQAIAIGLSKARRAGVKLPPPKRGKASARTRKQAKRDIKRGGARRKKPSRTRSRATKGALKREKRSAASHKALSRQAHSAARRRSARSRSAAAKKAVRTRKRRR
jgi:hypothetical protein